MALFSEDRQGSRAHRLLEVTSCRQVNGLDVVDVGEHVGNEQVLRVESDVQEEPVEEDGKI